MCKEKEIRFIDLFGGIGGFRYGLEKASERYKCVWYCDNDKYAVQTYNKNFREEYKPTDITKVPALAIPECDMLCGGFPCQSFSIAGKRGGFDDTRGTMFFEIARIIKTKKPKVILLENVKGLLNHSKGETFKVILQTLDELGYGVQWMVLNSKFHGVPQNRERVFIIGHLRGTSGGEILSFGKDAGKIQGIFEGKIKYKINSDKKDYRVINDNGIAPSLQAKNDTHKIIDKSYKAHRANEIREHNGSPTLTQNMRTGGHNVPLVIKSVKTPDRRPRQQGRWIKDNDESTFTLNTQDKDGIMIDNILRRLTPMECERLQGFPDNWTDSVSDIQRYRQLGNAVTTNVITVLGSKLLNYFDV